MVKKSWRSRLPRNKAEITAAEEKLAEIARRYQISPGHKSYFPLLALALATEYAPEFRTGGRPIKWDQSTDHRLYVEVMSEIEHGAKNVLAASKVIAKKDPWKSLVKQTKRGEGQSAAEYLRQRFQRIKTGLGTWRDVVAQDAAREGGPDAETIKALATGASDDTVDIFVEIDPSTRQVLRRHVILRKERRRRQGRR